MNLGKLKPPVVLTSASKTKDFVEVLKKEKEAYTKKGVSK